MTPGTQQYDGRYAPSPTGDLHLGNLRTALAAWLHARAHGARLVLRIDDLDPDRVRPKFARRQLDDLAAIGLDWDGDPIWQGTRTDRYEAALARLATAGATYPCFCTRADIRAAATASHDDGPELAYPGTCASLTEAEVERRHATGELSCVRVRARAARVTIHDDVLGSISCTVDDFVVRRKDGVAAYLLATTVDDAELGIGTVVRGADLATSAPRQAWLAEALGIAVPHFAHVPLVLGADGARLAKRHGAVTLRDLAAQGHDARTVRGLLARSLDLAAPGEEPTASALIDRFDVQRLAQVSTTLETL